MWLTSSKEEAFEYLPFTAKDIALEVEKLGGEWGCWIYNNDFEIAKWSNGEDSVAYFDLAISTDMPVPTIIKEVSESTAYSSRCYHSHDCCGCVFFKRLSVSINRLTTRKEMPTLTFKEEWGRNV